MNGAPGTSCRSFPCPSGHRCSYVNYSTWCQECPRGLYSAEGLVCALCPPGHQPNTAKNRCDACAPGTAEDDRRCSRCDAGKFSVSKGALACKACPPGKHGKDNRRECENCTRARYSDKSGSTSCTSCTVGDVGTNARSGCYPCAQLPLLPLSRKAYGNIQCVYLSQKATADDTTKQVDACNSCKDLPCIDCTGHAVRIAQGWARAPPLPLHPNVVLLLQCPQPSACLSTVSVANCTQGYGGLLCDECEHHHYRSHFLCVECSTQLFEGVVIVAVCGVLLGSARVAWKQLKPGRDVAPPSMHAPLLDAADEIVSPPPSIYDDEPHADSMSLELLRWSTYVGAHTLEHVSGAHTPRPKGARVLAWKLRIRLTWQSLKIVISLCQVVGQLGEVLHVHFSQDVRMILSHMQLVLVNVFNWVHPECIGLTRITAFQVWALTVLFWPALMGCVVFIIRGKRSKQGLLQEAVRDNLRHDALFCLFLLYPSICRQSFSILNCRLVGPRQVLYADYATECKTPEWWFVACCAGVVIVVVVFGAPIALLVQMYRAARLSGSLMGRGQVHCKDRQRKWWAAVGGTSLYPNTHRIW